MEQIKEEGRKILQGSAGTQTVLGGITTL